MSGYQSYLNLTSFTSNDVDVDDLTVNNSLTITNAELIGLKTDDSTITYDDNTVGLYVLDLGITNAKLYGGIDATKISSGLISNTEFDYLNGVGSQIVGESDTNTLTNKTIDSDLNTITNIGTSEIKDNSITNAKIQGPINANNIGDGITIISNTEFSYLDGATSNIQTQLNSINTQITNLSSDIDQLNIDVSYIQDTEIPLLQGQINTNASDIITLGNDIAALSIQDVYTQSTDGYIITNGTNNALKLRSGVLDTSTIFDIRDTSNISNLSILANGSLIVNSLTISPTELGYLDGTTSNIQTQINSISSTISLQNVFNNSTSPQIVTTASNPILRLKCYSDSDHLLSFANSSGTENGWITGDGIGTLKTLNANILADNDTDVVRIQSDVYFKDSVGIGIGTNSPATNFHIQSNDSVGIFMESDLNNINENDVPTIHFSQDGQYLYSKMGINSGNRTYIATYSYGFVDSDSFAIATKGQTSSTVTGTIPTIDVAATTRFYIDTDCHVDNADLNIHDNEITNALCSMIIVPFIYANTPANSTFDMYLVASGHSISYYPPFVGVQIGFTLSMDKSDFINYAGTIQVKFYLNGTNVYTSSAYPYTSWTSGTKNRFINVTFGTRYSTLVGNELWYTIVTSATYNNTGADINIMHYWKAIV